MHLIKIVTIDIIIFNKLKLYKVILKLTIL